MLGLTGYLNQTPVNGRIVALVITTVKILIITLIWIEQILAKYFQLVGILLQLFNCVVHVLSGARRLALKLVVALFVHVLY